MEPESGLYYFWILIAFFSASFFGGMMVTKLSKNQDFGSAYLLLGVLITCVGIGLCWIKTCPLWMVLIGIVSAVPLSIVGGKRVHN
ncbi:MAG: cyanate permease [Luteibaculaceae bacterium]|jgi:cyanate permease